MAPYLVLAAYLVLLLLAFVGLALVERHCSRQREARARIKRRLG